MPPIWPVPAPVRDARECPHEGDRWHITGAGTVIVLAAAMGRVQWRWLGGVAIETSHADFAEVIRHARQVTR